MTTREFMDRVRREIETHAHEGWQLQQSVQGGWYCAACGQSVGADGHFDGSTDDKRLAARGSCPDAGQGCECRPGPVRCLHCAVRIVMVTPLIGMPRWEHTLPSGDSFLRCRRWPYAVAEPEPWTLQSMPECQLVIVAPTYHPSQTQGDCGRLLCVR